MLGAASIRTLGWSAASVAFVHQCPLACDFISLRTCPRLSVRWGLPDRVTVISTAAEMVLGSLCIPLRWRRCWLVWGIPTMSSPPLSCTTCWRTPMPNWQSCGRGSVRDVARPPLGAGLVRPRLVAARESDSRVREPEGPTLLLGRVLQGRRVAVVAPRLRRPATPIEELPPLGEFCAHAFVVGASGESVRPHRECEQGLVHRRLEHEPG